MQVTDTTPVVVSEPRIGRSVSLDHAAQLLGVSRRTIYYRIRAGRLRTVRIGVSQRVLVESIEALLQEQAARARAAAVSDRDPCGRCPAL